MDSGKGDGTLMDSELYTHATEFIWNGFGIWQRYNKEFDPHHHGNPHPNAKTEPIYAISLTTPPNEVLFKREVYSKSEHDFVYLSSPSERTDAEILDTSFTLDEAYLIIKQLLELKKE